ncbi:hypothetical protein [Opitutus terrae]|nr:hypothetical protein [Opitutus terrae]
MRLCPIDRTAYLETMGRNWEPIGRTLQGLTLRCQELGGAPDPAWLKLPVRELATTLRAAEALDRLPCDALMRALLRGGGIGQPTPRQGYFCAMRCLCALDTLGIIHAELNDHPLYPEPPTKWTDEQLLEWLLVSNWQQRHDTWLKLNALSAATGLGLYSG